jgi:protein-L-isoaspartate O-methyltransferase
MPSTRDEAVRLDGSGDATVSAMHAYARSFSLAGVAAGQRVLDLGGGTGYGAALLARVVGKGGAVVTVELDGALTPATLGDSSAVDLRSNIVFINGDALDSRVLAEAAERAGGAFDAILVGFALAQPVGEELLAVLGPSGSIVATVVDEGPGQHLTRVRKHAGKTLETEHLEEVFYVRQRTRGELPVTAREETAVAARKPEQPNERRVKLPLLPP